MNVRALEIWKEEEKKFPSRVFHKTGVLWLCHGESNPIVDDSIPYAVKYNAGYERLNIDQLHQRYPMINSLGLSHAYFDPYGGYLKAREACQGVQGLFIREGGQFIQAHVAVRQPIQRHVSHLSLSNGTTINSDIFIFACGSWLPTMFGELSPYLNCTRQEVYYFGVPEKHSTIFDTMPVWIDLDGKDFYYGIPGNAQRGFKVGVDIRGPSFNPTSDDRVVDPIVLQRARTFLLNRFPLLRDAPLIESRVCPYENSSTGNFIFDLIPGIENAFVLGGGSGHGFKHGPALGELITSCLTGSTTVPEIFRLH
jgi:glycine/D-amino acid oxidase-like deaminating enzyme